MGNDTLTARSNGQIIDQTWYNVIRSALNQDFLPRNSSGIVTDQSGSLGSATYSWLNQYLQKLRLMNGANSVDLIAPSLSGSYQITVPASAPGSTLPISMNSSGVLSTGQIVNAQIANNAITQVKKEIRPSSATSVGSGGYMLSSSCGSFTSASTSYVDVSFLTGVIVTNGNPVWVGLVADGSAVAGAGVGNVSGCQISIVRDSTTIAEYNIQPSSASTNLLVPVSSVFTLDTGASAASHTYKIQAKGIGGDTVIIGNAKLLIYEL